MLVVGWAFSFADVTAVDAEAFSKKIGASFHWFPVQKSFIMVAGKDTAKFAVGIPYASVNGSTIDLSASPVLDEGHLWIAEDDIDKLFPTQNSAKAAPEKEMGFVAVSCGKGLDEIFKSLGVDYLIASLTHIISIYHIAGIS